MNGGSLGVRTSGSLGSLQQPLQNGGLSIPRRPSKTSLSGYKEKERTSPSAFRYLSRKKVAMLLLFVFALVALLTGFFTVSKVDDLESTGVLFDEKYVNSSHSSPPPLARNESFPNASTKSNRVLVCHESKGWSSFIDSSAVVNSSNDDTLLPNQCKDFAFPPPPPVDTRRFGPRPCPVCYVPVDQAKAHLPKLPSQSPVLRHLTYFSEENILRSETYVGSDFGGYPSLNQRNDSFDIRESMTVHCGFVRGCKPGNKTGFDIEEDDLEVLEQFHEVIVASAIFGNYDVIQQPRNVGETTRKNVPFFMFIDEETESYMKNSSILGIDKKVGLWRIIVVRNVPYTDSRRNGKVPKLLLHRLFPNTRFSIWIDGKLQLVADPYQVLERFLWRENATFAISRHYSRFDVFVEAEANKAGGKYDNTSIDYQINFYKKEGLTPYTSAKLPITSDVPEGCVIIREHIPITNLFSCLWFNEVDRFTARDQLSFSTVRDKIIARVNWRINMFLDCERRNFVVQAYHKDLLEQRAHLAAITRRHTPISPPSSSSFSNIRTPPKKGAVRRGREKRRHRSRVIIPRNDLVF